MYQRDYMLRMIAMLAELVAGILGLIKKGDFKRASESIENAYKELLKEDAVFFSKIPIEELTDKLIREHNYTSGHLEILSELFYTQAELLFAEQKYHESCEYYQRSLHLYKFVINKAQTFSFDKQSKLTYMEKRIGEILES